jgi:hypothetical protein
MVCSFKHMAQSVVASLCVCVCVCVTETSVTTCVCKRVVQSVLANPCVSLTDLPYGRQL